jgi:hypothetical protein
MLSRRWTSYVDSERVVRNTGCVLSVDNIISNGYRRVICEGKEPAQVIANTHSAASDRQIEVIEVVRPCRPQDKGCS